MPCVILFTQFAGLAVVSLLAAALTLQFDASTVGGAPVIFRGGQFTSGEFYQGPELNWSFTNEIRLLELRLDETPDSRTKFIIESHGRIFVTCDYMGSPMGRFWKRWAVQATQGNGTAELRIGDVRSERTLKRITEGPEIDWVIRSKIDKYRLVMNREMIAARETWVFEIAPRS